MQRNNENPSFFDPKTLIAVASVALVYFGWQTYLGKKYPGYGKSQVSPKQNISLQSPGANGELHEAEKKSEVVFPAPSEERLFSFNGEKVSFDLTSQGMGLKNFTIKTYKDKDNNNIKLGSSGDLSLFELRWAGSDKPLYFNVTEGSPGHFFGIAQVGDTVIKRELKFNPTNYSFTNTVTVINPNDEFKKGFSLFIPEKIHTKASSSFLFPSFEVQDFFVIHNGGKHEVIHFGSVNENINKEINTSSILSVGSQYFAAAIMDKSDILPSAVMKSDVNNHTALGMITYQPVQLKPEMTFRNVLYAGPKSTDILRSVEPELAHIVDFGFFGFIASPLLFVLKACHSVVGNWGFAIILLTLFVRFCVLPFNVMSFRSMKAMQRVQPAIQALREKYKEDPMRLNQEMMAVMKENGANPIGGCLPMLLQIPIFFALYKVIGSSVDLYGSPFIGWIHDLSAHDPFYVLPVLMSVFMFIQQKITPTTMDPLQAKIMLFLPVVFSLFMLQLPSGLTLYMVVSTLFGIVQQYLIMREKSPAKLT